jgi:OOP family OmpA-OmpF porin
MKMMRICLAAATLLLQGQAFAEDQDVDPNAPLTARTAIGGRYYVAPMGSYTLADSHRGTKDGIGGALVVGLQARSDFHVEVAALYSSFKSKSGGKSARLTGGQADAMFFPGGHNFYGLIGLGFGHVSDHPGPTPGYANSMLSAGAGYLVGPFNFIVNGMSIRAEALFRQEFHTYGAVGKTSNNGFSDYVFNLGLMIPIGAAPPGPAAAPEPEAVQVVPVETAPAPVADSDGDGVSDQADQCPDTAAGTAVDEKGCPQPVAASAAKCEAPQPGQTITLDGCAAGDTIVLRGVNFEFNRDTLTLNAKAVLDGVADALKTASTIRVEVVGHTDSKGSDSYNLKLSEARARSVIRYLTEVGVAADRMSPKGLGSTQPVADNASDEGRALNRRVELKILG